MNQTEWDGGRTGSPRIAIVFNPVAGWRRRRRLDAVLRALAARGAAVTVLTTAARGDAARLARMAAGTVDIVAAAGGDGTINEVANGLLAVPAPQRPALGIVPLGTANVLAREIGLALNAAAAADALVGGHALQVRLGRLQAGSRDEHFLMMAGIGFDAAVVAAVSPRLKRWLGKGAYVWQSLRHLLRYRPRFYEIAIDGVPHRAASAIVSRGRHYAGPYTCAPAASLAAPQLHVCLFERAGRGAVMRYGAALLLDRLPQAAGYRVVPATRVEIVGGAGDAIQADGDHIAHLPATIGLAAEDIRLLVPRPA